MTVAEFTQALSKNECKSVVSACLIPETDCLSTRQAYWSQVASEEAKAGRPFDPKNADACLSKVRSVYAALDKGMAIKAADYRDMKHACGRVFHGTSALNGLCAVDADCVDDLICDKQHCGNAIEVGPGKGCANIGEYCSQGFVCETSRGIAMCVARANKEAACTSDDSCLEALRCAGGVCVEGLGIGVACEADEDCDSGFCEPFAFKCGNDIRFASGSPACQNFQASAAVVSAADADAENN